MKKTTALTLMIAVFAMALSAQDVISVSYKGSQPTISDFVTAFVTNNNFDDGDCCIDESFHAISHAWQRYIKGLPLDEDETITVDKKNGYVLYEYKSEYESTVNVVKIEMCYWNEADGKHKLFAYNVVSYTNGHYSAGQYDGITFYRYTNAKKKMTYCEDQRGIEALYKFNVVHSLELPRTGKDITATLWYDSGKKVKTLKWNGNRFTL